MRKFRNGEREFKENEVVFLTDKYGVKGITPGIINYYSGFGEYAVDLLCLKSGSNIDEIKSIKSYQEGVSKGLIVRIEDDLDFKRKHPDDPRNIRIKQENIFHTEEAARQEIEKRKREAAKERERRKLLSESELCKEDNERYLKSSGLLDEEILYCMDKIESDSELPSMEDIDIRRFENEIQWKDGFVWKTLMKLERPEPEKHDERYYVNIYHVWDADMESVLRGFTNEPPESIFEKYNDYTEYVVNIADKKWSIEKCLEVPNRYYLGVKNNKGKIEPVLVTQYVTDHGKFELIDGRLSNFDISIDAKCKLYNSKIVIFNKTRRNEQEIRDLILNKIKKLMGEFADLFTEKIKTLDIIYLK